MMNLNEQAREHLTHDRGHEEQRQHSMETRTKEEMEHSATVMEEQAREHFSEHRLQQEQLEDKMSMRTESEIDSM